MLKIEILKKMCRFFIVAFSIFLAQACFPDFSRAAPEAMFLRIENMEGDNVFCKPMNEGESFAISFTHSVALTPVTDYYRFLKGKMILDRTVYQDFGAGLPHMPEEGQKMRVENGKIIIEGYNRVLPSFDVRVGRVANHVLLFPVQGGDKMESIPLKNLAAPGKALRFSIVNECGEN